MNSQIVLENQSYTILDKITKQISDSFVDKSIKTGSGSGETRLYISQQSSQSSSRFFTFNNSITIPVESPNRKGSVRYYNPCYSNGFFLKDNIIKYMEDSYMDYMFPKYNFNNNISLQYENKLNEIKSLNSSLPFIIHNQNGEDDESRFYIGSGTDIWHKVRSYILPFTSSFIIYKLSNNDTKEITYWFQLVKNGTDVEDFFDLGKSEDTIVKDIKNDVTIDSTEKESLIKSRKGQGKFKKNALELMNSCPFTGISDEFLLRGSHIMPWARCKTNEQRLTGFNGLILTPTYDVLFDKGFISFENNGKLLVSRALGSDTIKVLNLIPGKIYDIYNIEGKRNIFLDYHRKNIFKK